MKIEVVDTDHSHHVHENVREYYYRSSNGPWLEIVSENGEITIYSAYTLYKVVITDKPEKPDVKFEAKMVKGY